MIQLYDNFACGSEIYGHWNKYSNNGTLYQTKGHIKQQRSINDEGVTTTFQICGKYQVTSICSLEIKQGCEIYLTPTRA